MRDEDLIIDTYTNASDMIVMEITHKPTGIRVGANVEDIPRHRLKVYLKDELQLRVNDRLKYMNKTDA